MKGNRGAMLVAGSLIAPLFPFILLDLLMPGLRRL